MEQLLLFVLVYTGITNQEGPVSIIYGQSDTAGVLIEKLYSLLYCTPGLVSLGNLSAQTNTLRTEANSYDIKEICGYDNRVSLLCCLVFLKWLISSTPDHWVTNKYVFPGWLDRCFQGNDSFSC